MSQSSSQQPTSIYTPKQLKTILTHAGWQVDIVPSSKLPNPTLSSTGLDASRLNLTLVNVAKDGLLQCVDGRPAEHPNDAPGPKILGGTLGVAAMRGVTNLNGIDAVIDDISAQGYTPAVHEDHLTANHEKLSGCGFFDSLWNANELGDAHEKPNFDFYDVQKKLLDGPNPKGASQTLKGEHAEKAVVINYVPDTTLEPQDVVYTRKDGYKDDDPWQRFVTDVWVLERLGLTNAYFSAAKTTSEVLWPWDGEMPKAIIIVPDTDGSVAPAKSSSNTLLYAGLAASLVAAGAAAFYAFTNDENDDSGSSPDIL